MKIPKLRSAVAKARSLAEKHRLSLEKASAFVKAAQSACVQGKENYRHARKDYKQLRKTARGAAARCSEAKRMYEEAQLALIRLEQKLNKAILKQHPKRPAEAADQQASRRKARKRTTPKKTRPARPNHPIKLQPTAQPVGTVELAPRSEAG